MGGLVWEDNLKEWKKAGQWHVEVYYAVRPFSRSCARGKVGRGGPILDVPYECEVVFGIPCRCRSDTRKCVDHIGCPGRLVQSVCNRLISYSARCKHEEQLPP